MPYLLNLCFGDMNEDILLDVKHLSIAFKQEKRFREVIKDVSFSINKGQTLGLVGESGSGKSVSSLAIMGLLDKKISRIVSGEITFLGKNKAMIFQEPMTALNPVIRCGAQVDEMLLLHYNINKQEAKQKTLELFKEVLLPDVQRVYNSYPFELSGGQRQRVMIAMAICCKPELLIADEPTTALDVTVQSTILDLLKDLQYKYNMSILFISHDLGVVHSISDKIAVIYKGNIVEQGLAEDIFQNPKEPYTKSLIASRPPLDKKPERLLTVNDFMQDKVPQVKVLTDEQIEQHNKKLYKSEPILQVKDLEINYPLKRNLFGKTIKELHAIDKLNFDVYKGETLGLVGESGCGKSTVGKAITRLIDISSGKICFEGKNLDSLTKIEKHTLRKDIQIIFQDPYSSLNPRKQIGLAIEEPMQVYNLYKDVKLRKDKVIELLNKVGLDETYYHRYPHQLSGGQRQRIGIARALSLKPKLIICDESVSALDVSVQAQVLNLLNDLKQDFSFTYIFISHDLSVVKYMSDRIIVMKQGRIVENGLAHEIYYHPKQPYTKQLISAIRQ